MNTDPSLPPAEPTLPAIPKSYPLVVAPTSIRPLSYNIYDAQSRGKMRAIQALLEGDLLAKDATWTLFVAAAYSYRYPTHLIPFPSRYILTNNKLDINAIVDIISDTPALSDLLLRMRLNDLRGIRVRVVDLLHWVLTTEFKNFLKISDKSCVEELLGICNLARDNGELPSHVFKVCKPLNSVSDDVLIENVPTKFGFYGNKIDCFYTLAKLGFSADDPLILDTSFKYALKRSPRGCAWGGSACGSMISCVAVCEYFNNPELTEMHIVPQKDSDGNDFLCEMAMVKRGSAVRVRYLLFYGKSLEDIMNHTVNTFSLVTCWQRYKFLLSMSAYAVVLASIGYANTGLFLPEWLVDIVKNLFKINF